MNELDKAIRQLDRRLHDTADMLLENSVQKDPDGGDHWDKWAQDTNYELRRAASLIRRFVESKDEVMATGENKPPSVVHQIDPPAPENVAAARKKAGLSQDEAAGLIGATGKSRYRTWQNYETPDGPGARPIPASAWELFLLKTGQHPALALVVRQPDEI